MYYTHPCTYCSKTFYTYNSDKTEAAKVLYEGIKKHLVEYGEDEKEYELDEAAQQEINQMYSAMNEHTEAPSGAYEL